MPRLRVIVTGGDGFCGWPTALYLSAHDFEVLIADDLSRRAIDGELGTNSLTPIASLPRRVARWRDVSGRSLDLALGDLTDPSFVEGLFRRFSPDAVVHFGQQRSAPYSMLDRDHAVRTQVNNVVGTLNLLSAIHTFAPSCHFVKLGTMGCYGTPNLEIEEGYLEVEHKGRKDTVPYPKQPGSFYHLSKVHDSNNLLFACRAWGLRATELNQGIVWGVQTLETEFDKALANRFDYDGIFGTALHRFCVQAADELALTVHGSGGQTRAWISVHDVVRCVRLALSHPPALGDCLVVNQFTEHFSVLAVAERVSRVAADLGHIAPVLRDCRNPRVEEESHFFRPHGDRIRAMGLSPVKLTDAAVAELIEEASRHRARIRRSRIPATVAWRGVPYWTASSEQAASNPTERADEVAAASSDRPHLGV